MLISRWIAWLPVFAGPLALAGFLLPWIPGSGPLSGESFSGFELIRVLGVLQASEASLDEELKWLALRLLILGIPVVATWITLLAPAHRWHRAYPLAASYLVLVAATLAGFSLATKDVPMVGGILMMLSVLSLLGSPFLRRISTIHWGRTAEAVPATA